MKEQNCKEDYLDIAVKIINNVLDIVIMEAEEWKTQQGQTVEVEEVQGDQGQGEEPAGLAPVTGRESRQRVREEWLFHPPATWRLQARRQPATRAMMARRDGDSNLYSWREK